MGKNKDKTFSAEMMLKPEILAGSEANWDRVTGNRNYDYLIPWTKRMQQLDAYTPQEPDDVLMVPTRNVDSTKSFNGRTYGGISILPGDTLWDLFGINWPYIYNLEVNKEFRSKYPNPNVIQPFQDIYFPITCEMGDADIWPKKIIDLPIPRIASDENVPISRMPHDSAPMSNTICGKQAAVLKGKLKFPSHHIEGCRATKLDIEYSYKIIASADVRPYIKYSTNGSESKLTKCITTYDGKNVDLTLDVDGAKFKLDSEGLIKIQTKKGTFDSIVTWDQENGVSGILSGGKIEVKGNHGSAKADQKIKIGPTGIAWVVSAKFTTHIWGSSKKPLIEIQQTYKAVIELVSTKTAAQQLLACKPMPVPGFQPVLIRKKGVREVQRKYYKEFDLGVPSSEDSLPWVYVTVIGLTMVFVTVELAKLAVRVPAALMFVIVTPEMERELRGQGGYDTKLEM